MNTYEIEVQRTSYVTLWVEADNEDEAQNKAHEEINFQFYDAKDSDWTVVSIEKESPSGHEVEVPEELTQGEQNA